MPEELVGLDPSEAGLVHHLRVVQAFHLQEKDFVFSSFAFDSHHVGSAGVRCASHRLDELLDDELDQVDPVLADLEALQKII